MDDRALALVSALIDGSLDEASGAELLAAARRDLALAAEIARQRALDGWLAARARPLDVEAVLRALPEAATRADRVAPRLTRRHARSASRAWIVAVCAALVALAAFVWWRHAHGPRRAGPTPAIIALHPVAQGYADEELPGGSFPGEPLAVRGGDGRRRVALVRFALPPGARVVGAELVLRRATGVGAVLVHAQPAPGTWTSADLRFYHVPTPGPVVGPLRDADGAARCDVGAAARAGASEFLLAGDAATDCAFAADGVDGPTLRLALEPGS